MPKLSAFARDETKMRDGVVIEFGAKLYLRIRSFSTPDYQPEYQRLIKPYRRRVQTSGDDPVQLKMSKKAAGRTILVGWGSSLNGQEDVDGNVIDDAEDLLDEDGAVIPFSQEKAVELLADPLMGALWEFVLTVGNDEALYTLEDLEDAAGNFETSSAGTSTTAGT